jgi:hypothetical protein
MASERLNENVSVFMLKYRQLRDLSDDNPLGLDRDARRDKALMNLCLEVWHAAFSLDVSERRDRRAFAAPVNPAFIVEWRDYQSRFASVIANVALLDLGVDIGLTDNTSAEDRFRLNWEFARDQAQEDARAVEAALKLALDDASSPWKEYPEGYADEILHGVDEWNRLKLATGFSLEDVFRRRELLPFTLIPKHVSDKHGEAERMSLFTHLQQAQEAFVFGLPFAALAMMRSVLELVLRQHYSANGNDLVTLINSSKNLPRTANSSALHNLRLFANSILHFGQVQVPDALMLERQLVSYLSVLRDLIERVPARTP